MVNLTKYMRKFTMACANKSVFLAYEFCGLTFSFPWAQYVNWTDQFRSKLRIWSHLLKKSFMENFIFCAVRVLLI